MEGEMSELNFIQLELFDKVPPIKIEQNTTGNKIMVVEVKGYTCEICQNTGKTKGTPCPRCSED